MDVLACDWGGRPGACWEFWKCEPCCGEPCNVGDGCKCLICWHFCGTCAAAQLYAHSLGQECAIVNHFLPVFCFGPCAAVAIRHNVRVMNNAGPPAGDISGLVGDIISKWCWGPCSGCQVLRGVEKDAWMPFQKINTTVDPFLFLRTA